MNLGEIKRKVKRILGDESGALIEDTDIVDWVNDAQIDIARKSEVLQDYVSQDVIADQTQYNLPDDFIKIVAVSYNGIDLSKTTRSELSSISPARDAESLRDTPSRYYLWGNRLWLFPKPNTDLSDGLIIYYVFSPQPLSDDRDVPTIPIHMHEAILDYCISKGREMNEELEGSAFSMNKYDKSVTLARDEAKDQGMESYPAIRVLPDDMGYF